MKNKGIILIAGLITTSCAQFVAPTGGATDKEPPKLIHVLPENKTKNFKGNSIILTFDELVDATQLANQLLVIPSLENPIETKVKNNTVTVKWNESLLDNTTYTFNFRKGITDLTEKNKAENLKLVFSTGNEIDSLSISGKIKSLATNKELLGVTIGLYKKDTLDWSKKKPTYMVQTDSVGNFVLENIKQDKYFVLAFDDKNNNLRYDQKTEQIGFLSDSLHLTENTTLPDIYIYPSDRSRNKIKRIVSRENDFQINLDKNVKNVQTDYAGTDLDITHKDNLIHVYKLSQPKEDTLKINFFVTDSLLVTDTLLQKIYFKEASNKKKKIEAFNIHSNISNNQEISSDVKYKISFEKPIVKDFIENLVFKTDTVEKEKLKIDWISKRELELSINTSAEKEVELIIPSNTFVNYLGDTNTVFHITNRVVSKSETGLIEAEVEDKTSNKIAILFNEGRNKELDRKSFTDRVKFENLIPGNYHISVIFDENNNGVWDPGNLYTLEQPEKMVSTSEAIRVRANFERIIKVE